MSAFYVLKTFKPVDWQRIRTTKIKPIAHAYYWNDSQGGYWKSLCGKEDALKNGLLPAFDSVPVCDTCLSIVNRPPAERDSHGRRKFTVGVS